MSTVCQAFNLWLHCCTEVRSQQQAVDGDSAVACRVRNKAAHLVTTIAHPETTEVANHLIGQGDNVLTAELVHPEELMSGLLSQVSYIPSLVLTCCGVDADWKHSVCADQD